MVKYEQGMWIWADHPEDVWRPAQVLHVSQKNLKVSFLSGKTVVLQHKKNFSVLSIGSFNEDMLNKDVCKDLSKMSSLSTESVLHCLRKAYYSRVYYSNLGAGTILAVNPFQDVNWLFNDEKVYEYHDASLHELTNLPAHVFMVAERALRYVVGGMGEANQSIIISGESGAGKTWTVRCLMRYLALVGMKTPCDPTRATEIKQDDKLSDSFVGDQIEHRILNSNPILEAFGNAATPRNHNSSRFGKYIQLQYDRCGNIVGAQLQVYLLEKTRVANHGDFEKPYHIFSQMLHGSTSDERKEWQLPSDKYPLEKSSSNTNLNNNVTEMVNGASECSGDEHKNRHVGSFSVPSDITKMDDGAAFSKTRDAMQSVGISPGMQSNIFKLLSAILHLETMKFEGDDDLRTPCTLSASCQSNVRHAASLLSVPINCLVQSVTVREIKAGSRSSDRRRSVFKRSCTRDECSSRRNALMKYLYEQLFIWLVRHIGNDLSSQPNEACSFIGLLDVYGFESFTRNGLEQLCINYANEKLQQYYVNNFLKLQQEELAMDGVTWEDLKLNDKMGCLTALESTHNSLFALLNEECRLNRPSNAVQLKDRIVEHFCESTHITTPRISAELPCFSVLHYAGSVFYDTESLISKNKDELPLEVANLLVNSKNNFIQQLISDKVRTLVAPQIGNRGKSNETVLTDFKKSLDGLVSTLSTTSCHYIRCIKPNQNSIPSNFNSFYVVDQLRSCGIVETVQICGQLHPHRMAYSSFISHFEFILRQRRNLTANVTSHNILDDYTHHQRTCDRILSLVLYNNPHLDRSKSWKFGKTYVFLSSLLFEILETERSKETLRSATKIQLAWLSFCHRKRCRQLLRRIINERNNAATILQRTWRMKIHLRRCARVRRLEIRLRNRSAIVIQRAFRQYKERLELLLQKAELEEFSILEIRRISPQTAKTVVSGTVAIAEPLKQSTPLSTPRKATKPKTFQWICSLNHNAMERYFPSMMQMNICRLSCAFNGPLELLSKQFTNFSCYSFYGSFDRGNTSYRSDVSTLTSKSYVDANFLPPCCFNLSDVDNYSTFSQRGCILPYSDVVPRCTVPSGSKV